MFAGQNLSDIRHLSAEKINIKIHICASTNTSNAFSLSWLNENTAPTCCDSAHLGRSNSFQALCIFPALSQVLNHRWITECNSNCKRSIEGCEWRLCVVRLSAAAKTFPFPPSSPLSDVGGRHDRGYLLLSGRKRLLLAQEWLSCVWKVINSSVQGD